MLFHLLSLSHLPKVKLHLLLSCGCQTFSPCSSLVGKSRMRARTGWGTKPSKSGSSPHTSTTSHWGETPPRWQKELSTCNNHLRYQVWGEVVEPLDWTPVLPISLHPSHLLQPCLQEISCFKKYLQAPSPYFHRLHCRGDAYISFSLIIGYQ